MRDRINRIPSANRLLFLAIYMGTAGLFVITSIWVIGFVRNSTMAVSAETMPERITNGYINYFADGSYISPESNQAIGEYILEFPEPQNAQVLEGWNTTQIWGYMTTYMAGGLQVDCSYCHALGNFGAETLEEYEAAGGNEEQWQNKKTARAMLLMVQDLNQNWITQLSDDNIQVAALPDDVPNFNAEKKPSGAQIICATCHYGQPNFQAWSSEDEMHAVPDNYRLPLKAEDGSYTANEDVINAALLVTGKDDQYSLDDVQYNQHTMTHMNNSLGVGCTHCHNSRWFPSWEQPAKYYSYTMLRMSQHIMNEYSEEWMNGQEPSCYMCHQGAIRPPGAAVSPSALPPQISSPVGYNE